MASNVFELMFLPMCAGLVKAFLALVVIRLILVSMPCREPHRRSADTF